MFSLFPSFQSISQILLLSSFTSISAIMNQQRDITSTPHHHMALIQLLGGDYCQYWWGYVGTYPEHRKKLGEHEFCNCCHAQSRPNIAGLR